jgi:FKBP-type peptidyl-prolyl cis-trans isomerase
MRWPLLFLLLFFGPLLRLSAQADTLHTASGLRYTIRQTGQGPLPGQHGKVAVHFVGKFGNGRIFDTSALRRKPLKVRLGRGEVIAAWEELLPQLPAGTKLTLFVPARLAYGPQGLPADFMNEYKVPPNTDLIFDMEVVKIYD